MGTLNMLGLAKRTKARFLITSTHHAERDPRDIAFGFGRR